MDHERADNLKTGPGLALGFVAWWLLYRSLAPAAHWYTYSVLGFPGASHSPLWGACCPDRHPGVLLSGAAMAGPLSVRERVGQGVEFFLFQAPHALMLLLLAVFVMGIVRSYFGPEVARRMLAGKRTGGGMILAAMLGVVTPFCSCSAVPLFIGFVTAGVPLGVTFAFLTAAPLVNEIALALLADVFGWKVALAYAGTGVCIALAAGWLVEKMGMRRFVEEWVYDRKTVSGASIGRRMDWNARVRAGELAVRQIVGKVWPYLLAGVLVGAVIHASVPREALVSALGKSHWWSVPLAVLIGVPIYSNAAGIIPIVQALIEKGVPVGTVLAFTMAVVGLSLPEFVILRKVLKLPLIITFATIVALGIMVVGVLFNWLL